MSLCSVWITEAEAARYGTNSFSRMENFGFGGEKHEEFWLSFLKAASTSFSRGKV